MQTGPGSPIGSSRTEPQQAQHTTNATVRTARDSTPSRMAIMKRKTVIRTKPERVLLEHAVQLIDDLQQLVNRVESLQPAIRRLVDDAEVLFAAMSASMRTLGCV